MNEKRILYFALGVLAVVSFGAVTNQAAPLSRSGGMAISDTAVTFPDGTEQTTAAAGPVAAWPMRCHGEALPPLILFDLVCRGLPAAPVSFFHSGSGVPAGYFVLVTDVLTQPNDLTSTEFSGVELNRHDSTSEAVESRFFRTSRGEEASIHYSFASPILVLEAGDYLRVWISGRASGGLETITVTGYLTDQPEKLRL